MIYSNILAPLDGSDLAESACPTPKGWRGPRAGLYIS